MFFAKVVPNADNHRQLVFVVLFLTSNVFSFLCGLAVRGASSKLVHFFGGVLPLFGYHVLRIPQTKGLGKQIVRPPIALLPQLLKGENDTSARRTHPTRVGLKGPTNHNPTHFVLLNDF
jgi:hypothetical protein